MGADDVRGAALAWKESDLDLRRRLGLPIVEWTDEVLGGTERRITHFLETDPAGSWVANDGDTVVGLSQAYVREAVWVLAHLFVSPASQSTGIGRALLDRALRHGDRAGPGLIVSSPDPRALRRYALAGFELHPTAIGWGPVRSAVAPSDEVREGNASDLPIADAVDRVVRGAARSADLAMTLAEGDRLLVADAGYAVLRRARVVLVAALDEATARALLRTAIAAVAHAPTVEVNRMTAAQQWAVEIVLEAGLELHAHGALMVRGRPGPLRPYIPDGAFA